MKPQLQRLLQDQRFLWRARETASQTATGISTGFTELDTVLPTGGWPADALLEIITTRWGIGELRLLLPAMAALSRAGLWIIWIAPPYIPYAPALCEGGVKLTRNLVLTPEDIAHDTPWSMEKILRTEACGMVLAWPKKLAERSVRRLQLAAEAGRSLGVLFGTTDTRSAAALRLRLETDKRGLRVHILKARGATRPTTVPLRV